MSEGELKQQFAPGQPWRTATGTTVWVINVTMIEMPTGRIPSVEWVPTVRYTDGSGIEYVQPLSRFHKVHTYAGVTNDE